MTRISRRAVLGAGALGALTVPAMSGLSALRWRDEESRVLLHDPALEAGRRFAQAGHRLGLASRPIEGDRIRFMRAVLATMPAIIVGVSRYADLLLIADVAAEAGYGLGAEFEGRGGTCAATQCLPGWSMLGRITFASGPAWAEALAAYVANPRAMALAPPRQATPSSVNAGLVLGWALAPRESSRLRE